MDINYNSKVYTNTIFIKTKWIKLAKKYNITQIQKNNNKIFTKIKIIVQILIGKLNLNIIVKL